MTLLFSIIDIGNFIILFAAMASIARSGLALIRPIPPMFELFAIKVGWWVAFVDFLYPWHQLRWPVRFNSAPDRMKIRWQLHQLMPWCLGWSALSVCFALLVPFAANNIYDREVAWHGAFVVWGHTMLLWIAFTKRVS